MVANSQESMEAIAEAGSLKRLSGIIDIPLPLLARLKQQRFVRGFTILTRVLLAIGFMPSGLTKVLGNRFTLLGIESPIGFFFEALFRTGFYWRFIGICQLTAALLLLIPRTTLLGALLYFPLILNIFVITVSLNFTGTPFITGPMLLGCTYLLCWDYDKLSRIFRD